MSQAFTVAAVAFPLLPECDGGKSCGGGMFNPLSGQLACECACHGVPRLMPIHISEHRKLEILLCAISGAWL